MITIELTKQQVKYVILSLEVLIRESEDEFGKLQFIKSDSGLASIFKNDIEELRQNLTSTKLKYQTLKNYIEQV